MNVLALRKDAAALSRRLGKCLKNDRTRALELIGEEAGRLNAKELIDELRRWGVQSRRKPTFFALAFCERD